MFSPSDRRYFDAWLKRAGKQLAASGRLSQVAARLAEDGEHTADEWSAHLRKILHEGEFPTLDLLMRIDAILATPARPSGSGDTQDTLF